VRKSELTKHTKTRWIKSYKELRKEFPPIRGNEFRLGRIESFRFIVSPITMRSKSCLPKDKMGSKVLGVKVEKVAGKA
jgi:hypothetical protein